jgi:metalloprotease
MAALIIPTLIAIGYALMMYRFSVWRTSRMLDEQSQPLTDPSITRLADRMATALDLPAIPVQVFEVDPSTASPPPTGASS